MTIFSIFRLMLETKDLEKGKWVAKESIRYWVHPEMTLSSPTFAWLREALACVQVEGRITAAEQKKT